jgi:HD-GYP domain-containing protein (c-di-GMP phosphodiesterase class II)
MNLPREDINILRNAGMLHDIGKIGISDEILKKSSTLDQEEQLLMRRHPEAGENIIASIDFLQEVRIIIRHHPERWDGNGYPNGLRDGDIPLLSRILSLADAYDAMTSARSYRPPLKTETVLEELRLGAGTQFDPQVVDCFFQAHQHGLIQ